MLLYLLLISASIQTVSINSNQIEFFISTRDTDSVATVILPIVDQDLPEVRLVPEYRTQFDRVMVAGGLKVVPLIIFLPQEECYFSLNIRYNRSIDRLYVKNKMASVIFPYLFDNDRSNFLGGYLIIVPDEFYDNILPLARWKERKGFKVWVKKTSETGNQRDQIRSYIHSAYNSWEPAPSYVLLVGAITKIPTFPTPGATSCVTDHPYSCVDGDDYLADLFVGRLPAANVSELDCMVAKIINYESNPFMDDTIWFHRALMVGTSYQEGGTPAVTALVTKRRIREQLLNRGFNNVDTVFYPPIPSGRGIIDTIVNRGVLFINGRGWGNYQGWGWPQYFISDVYNLDNGWKLPIITSLYCGTGNYQANPCFGEAWLRAGTPSAPKGGIAFWGASYSGTSTRWNNCMDYGIYNAIFDRVITTIGPAMYLGKIEQLINFPLPQDSTDLKIYFHVYNLLGDPGMEMWTSAPKEISVSYPNTYPLGTGQFTVRVVDRTGTPISEAIVCLYKPGDFQQVRITNSSGEAQFTISPTTTDTLFITVTGKNLKPHLGWAIGEQRGVLVGYFHHSPAVVNPGDTTDLSVVLKNYGISLTANNVQAVLRTKDCFATVIDSLRVYGSLSPGEEASSTPFRVYISPTCTSHQVIPFLIQINSGDSMWNCDFNLLANAPTLKVIRYLVYDANGYVDPGEIVEIGVKVRNNGGTNAHNVIGVLRSSNPFAITVIDSIGTFGDIPIEDSAMNEIDRFVLQTNSQLAINRRFTMYLELTGDGGFKQRVNFQIVVGEPVINAPLGPDRYGYWGYDDTDSNYQEHPVFDWVEIDPNRNRGGSGTRLQIGDNQAVAVNLPFTFKFYGRNYRTISVSDNGYIAMGNSWFSDPYNWSIPSAQGPDGFVAVFWDDFRCDTLNASGIYYYYDEHQHRFIVEWSDVYHIHGFRNPIIAEQQTFQVILYEPSHHYTITGDGPMICQYLSVRNDDSLPNNNHNYATVGIQSPDHKDGLEWTFANRYVLTAAPVIPGRVIKFTTNPPDTFTGVSEFKGRRKEYIIAYPAVTRHGVWLEFGGQNGMVQVWTVTGRLVREFRVTPPFENKRIWWNLTDQKGKPIGSGVYLVRLTGVQASDKIIKRECRIVVVR